MNYKYYTVTFLQLLLFDVRPCGKGKFTIYYTAIIDENYFYTLIIMSNILLKKYYEYLIVMCNMYRYALNYIESKFVVHFKLGKTVN